MRHATPSNLLTISRLFLAPILIPWSITHLLGSSVFVLSALATTDYLDGLCARMWRQETRLGAWLDPLADKVLLASVLFPLVSLHIVHWAIALIFILREFIVLATRHVAAIAGMSITVSRWGKCKTTLQLWYLCMCLLPHTAYGVYLQYISMALALGASVGSMLEYIYRFLQRI